MKKLFNHSKKEYHRNLEWEDEEYTDDEYLTDEDTEAEYYEDDENADEYYEGEESVEYSDANSSEEYYEDENQPEEYYEDSEESGEYYEDENQNEEYYEESDELCEEEALNDSYDGSEQEEYYEEDTEQYEDEIFEDEEDEDDEFYEEEAPVRRRNQSSVSRNTAGNYATARTTYERTASRGNDRQKSHASSYRDERDESNFFNKISRSIRNMSTLDRVVTTTGVLVLILALVTGAVFFSANVVSKKTQNFEAVGSQLANVTLIGEHGLTAVADAELAKIQAANAIEEENENPADYEENEFTKAVEVAINVTSIEKDMKIKFVNAKTNKLVANVPFVVSVKTPGGKSENWTDDDMDGIIYKSGITPGDYSVTLNPLTDSKYADFTLPTSAKKATVKKEIAYQKVEVSDEIKDESEINTKKEDTKENDTQVESALTDTVAWVESTKTVLDATYIAVAKNTITDPLATARSYSFMRTASVTMPNLSLTLGAGGTKSGSVAVTTVPEGFTEFKVGTINYISSDPSVATVDPASGAVEALKVGTTTINFTATVVKPGVASTEPSGGSTEGSASDGNSTPAPAPVTNVEETVSGSCTVTVSNMAVAVTQVSLNKTTTTLLVGATETLVPTITPTDATDKNVTWNTSDATVVSVDSTGKITALKVGTATVTATSTADNTKKAECVVTVPNETKTLKLNADKLPMTIGVPVTIQATVSTSVTGGNVALAIVASAAPAGIVELKVGTTVNGVTPITITPKAVGTTLVTVKAGDSLTATCNITVTNRDITLDAATAKVISSGKKTINAEVKSLGGEFKVTTSDAKIATATIAATKGTDKTTAKVEITGVAAGSATITIIHTEGGVETKKTCTVTVVSSVTKLVDSQKRQLYKLQADGKYREAMYVDYYDSSVTQFYLRTEGTTKYTGWQTLDNKLYYFDASGNKITGEQVIQGAKYNFASDGSLVVGSGSFGIDVSKWNGTIDWNAVKNSGVNYVIIRCGYRGSSTGVLVEDPKFAKNIKGATAAGIKVGVYFFTQAVNNSEAVEEASMVIELIKKYTISYPVFLDVESSGGRGDGIDKATRTSVIKAFCETIQNSGYTAGVYANKSWLTNKIDTSQLGKYKIWLAQYASAPTYSGRYDMWQYKSTGKVSGISGNVDMNVSYLGY